MSRIIKIDSLHSGDRKNCSTNGNGIRIVVWFLGCDIHCVGCHNQEYWDFDNTKFENFSNEHIQKITEEIKNNQNIYSGLSILGGEPFSERNINDVITLCEDFKYNFTEKDIWIWTGHTIKWLNNQNGNYGEKINNLLGICDVLIDGQFDLSKRNISLKFRGSTNQIIWKKNENNEWVESDLNN